MVNESLLVLGVRLLAFTVSCIAYVLKCQIYTFKICVLCFADPNNLDSKHQSLENFVLYIADLEHASALLNLNCELPNPYMTLKSKHDTVCIASPLLRPYVFSPPPAPLIPSP